jgi:hypothetical protein
MSTFWYFLSLFSFPSPSFISILSQSKIGVELASYEIIWLASIKNQKKTHTKIALYLHSSSNSLANLLLHNEVLGLFIIPSRYAVSSDSVALVRNALLGKCMHASSTLWSEAVKKPPGDNVQGWGGGLITRTCNDT